MAIPIPMHRSPSTKSLHRVQIASPAERILLPLFGNHIHATRSVVKRLRPRLATDDDIIAYIETLQHANWPNWAIKETILFRPYPPLQIILRLQRILSDAGVPNDDAIMVLARIKCIGSMHDPDAFAQKIALAFNGNKISIPRTNRELLRIITFIATSDEEKMRLAAETLNAQTPVPRNWFVEMQKQLRKRPPKLVS